MEIGTALAMTGNSFICGVYINETVRTRARERTVLMSSWDPRVDDGDIDLHDVDQTDRSVVGDRCD